MKRLIDDIGMDARIADMQLERLRSLRERRVADDPHPALVLDVREVVRGVLSRRQWALYPFVKDGTAQKWTEAKVLDALRRKYVSGGENPKPFSYSTSVSSFFMISILRAWRKVRDKHPDGDEEFYLRNLPWFLYPGERSVISHLLS